MTSPTALKLSFFDVLTCDSAVSHLEARIAWRLLHYVGRTGLAWPSPDTLATEVDVDERTVRRAVKHLIELGYFSIASLGGGRGRTTRYRPCLERGAHGSCGAPKGGTVVPIGGRRCGKTGADVPSESSIIPILSPRQRGDDALWEPRLRRYAETGWWPSSIWGDPPGHPRCEVPHSVLARHRLGKSA